MSWEPIIVALITGGLGLVGVVVTVRGARRSSTEQHVEQTHYLTRLSDRVDDLAEGQNVLFNMVVDLDSKVTKSAKKSRVQSGMVKDNVHVEP